MTAPQREFAIARVGQPSQQLSEFPGRLPAELPAELLSGLLSGYIAGQTGEQLGEQFPLQLAEFSSGQPAK